MTRRLFATMLPPWVWRALAIFYGGLALGGVIIVLVFLSGGTFGQRCAKLHPINSPGWQNCVELFATGHPRS